MSVTHLMIDLESLAKREDAVITSLACVPFTFEEKASYDDLINRGFYVKFSIKEQIAVHHRATDNDTLEWWKKQSKEARDAAIAPCENDRTMEAGLTELATFIKSTDYKWGKGYLWARGANYFDYPKIEHMHHQLNKNMPFNTWKIRDVRTYVDILTGVDNGQYTMEFPGSHVAHNCLDDCVKDIMCMKEIYDKLLTT